ncbi:MAG: hypothetical protein ACLQF1_03185 [Methyloceanibacter sp.]|jgi:hypothetical protein
MKAHKPLLPVLGLVLTACATPMAMRDIEAIRPNCSRIDRQIAALEREKAENDQRLLAGVQSVAPALVVLSLVRGTYGSNVAIATGEWPRVPSIASSPSFGAPNGPARAS